MGTKMAPNFADDISAEFEKKYVYTYQDQPLLWARFLDDIFLIWTHGIDKLHEILHHLNSLWTPLRIQSIS